MWISMKTEVLARTYFFLHVTSRGHAWLLSNYLWVPWRNQSIRNQTFLRKLVRLVTVYLAIVNVFHKFFWRRQKFLMTFWVIIKIFRTLFYKTYFKSRRNLSQIPCRKTMYWGRGRFHTRSCAIKFIYSEKATIFCEIFTLLLAGTT